MSCLMVSRVAPAIVALLVGAAQAQQQGSQPPEPSPPAYQAGELLKDSANSVAAEVDGHPITQADIGDAIAAQPPTIRSMPFAKLYPLVLERLIQEQALDARARGMHLDNDPVVRRHIQAAANGILANELLNRLIDKSVNEEALLARYRTEYEGRQGPEQVDVSVILLPSEEQARKVIAEIVAGADFAAVARRDSKDISASNGGELGYMRLSQLAPEVGAVAFALSPGQMVPNPVHSPSGWFVIKIAARRQGPALTFAEAREQLRHQMMHEQVAQVVQETLAGVLVRRFGAGGSPADPVSPAR